ncbi:MAG: HD domain-containing protein [Candidatus Aminicenantes bacterium]|nr:HD domain-containing protein [Candidatus Aminicenantes bacterium]
MKLKADFRHSHLFVNLFDEDVYAVGGYVRDILRGVPSEDVDLLITRHPLEKIIEKLDPYGRVDLVGKSFGIIKFTIDHKTYDIALPRKDIPRPSEVVSHKDFIIQADPFLPLEKDLARRDFRCNSMALRLKDGQLIDPFGGAEDIRAKIIRLTNPAAFPEDPLRVLRVARFASVLEFSVDPQIYELCKTIDLSGLSTERINEELFKILLHSPFPSRGLEEMFRLSVLKKLYPELYLLTFSLQDPLYHPEKDEYGHHTVWFHTKLTVDQGKRVADLASLPQGKRLALLLACLFHDVGKPKTADWEFKKGRMVLTNNCHDLISEKITRDFLTRYKIFSWENCDLRELVPLLVRWHHRLSELWQNRQVITKRALNRLMADVQGEIELLIYLDQADRAGRRSRPLEKFDRQTIWFKKKLAEWNITKETIKPIILGRDLIPFGVEPGPTMGKILKKIYELQLEAVFETKEEGLRLAQEIIRKELRKKGK